MADFGLALVAETVSRRLSISSASRKGTVQWLAPEILDPDASKKARSDARKRDIYAFACAVLEVRRCRSKIMEFFS